MKRLWYVIGITIELRRDPRWITAEGCEQGWSNEVFKIRNPKHRPKLNLRKVCLKDHKDK